MTDADEAIADIRRRVAEFLAEWNVDTTDRREFLRARFDAGLAWVYFPVGLGGLGLPRNLQPVVDDLFVAAGAPDNNPRAIGIGLGMAAPTILAHGTEAQKQRFLRPLWTGEEVWCQLFSEPGAGSDLAALSTRAELTGQEWVVNGQKVWTSMAHKADWGILLARTDPNVPKHAGITYFLCDMKDPGVEVRPLRQITGEAEFNEVFLTNARIPDAQRLGALNDGWRVARTTLNNERVSLGGAAVKRESGLIGVVAKNWREHPERRTPELRDQLVTHWVGAEVARLAGERLRQKLAAGQPGPEGAAIKLATGKLNQQLSGFEIELCGADGLRYADWTMTRPDRVETTTGTPGFRYLRIKGRTIEGGTSEVLRNIVAERILGLPSEPRTDTDVPWKEMRR